MLEHVIHCELLDHTLNEVDLYLNITVESLHALSLI